MRWCVLRVVSVWCGSAIGLTLGLACGGDEPRPAPVVPVAPAAPAAPAAPPKVEPVTAPPKVEAPPPDDWLVWYATEGRVTTLWVDAARPHDGVVARKNALVLSDGSMLWHVARRDTTVDVMGCDCVFEPKGACTKIATFEPPGLRAVGLTGGATDVAYRATPAADDPERSGVVGRDFVASLELAGGVGDRLWVHEHEEGYYCGAHVEVEQRARVFTVGADRVSPMKEVLGAVASAVPGPVRKRAARALLAQLRECGEFTPPLPEFIEQFMQLTAVRAPLVDGAPRLVWRFEAETSLACSSDYAVQTEVSAPQMAVPALGIDASLPAAVGRAMAEIGSAPIVGWAELSLEGDERASALAAFSAVTEAAWPPGTTTPHSVVGAPADSSEREEALDLVREAQRLIRAGDYAAALRRYDESIAADPTLARGWSERGYAKLLAGQLGSARKDFVHALPMHRGVRYQAAVRYNLGLVAERLGEHDAARAELAASLELRDDETVRRALARVEDGATARPTSGRVAKPDPTPPK